MSSFLPQERDLGRGCVTKTQMEFGFSFTWKASDNCLYFSLKLARFSLPLILTDRTALLWRYITVITDSFSLPPAQGEQVLSPTGAGARVAFSQTLWGSWPCSSECTRSRLFTGSSDFPRGGEALVNTGQRSCVWGPVCMKCQPCSLLAEQDRPVDTWDISTDPT